MGRKSIRFDFIKQELWRKLPKSISSELRSYRGYYGNYVKEEIKIKELELEIENHRSKMNKYKIQMHKKNKELDYLRNQFTFWVSLIKTKQKGKHTYYMLSVSRSNLSPKNCYLGNEVKIMARLKEFYQNDKNRLLRIDKDWYGELNADCKVGIVWDRIMDLIINLNENFQKTTINLDTLYPLKQLK